MVHAPLRNVFGRFSSCGAMRSPWGDGLEGARNLSDLLHSRADLRRSKSSSLRESLAFAGGSRVAGPVGDVKLGMPKRLEDWKYGVDSASRT